MLHLPRPLLHKSLLQLLTFHTGETALKEVQKLSTISNKSCRVFISLGIITQFRWISSLITLQELGLLLKGQNPRGEKQHQVLQPPPKLLLKKLNKLNLQRVHQQVNLQTCTDQALHPSNRTCMPMITIMLT